MTRYDDAKRQLKSAPRNWAISGAAGFHWLEFVGDASEA